MSTTSTALVAFTLVLVAGTLQGAFALPMSYIKRWRWENTWLAYSLVAFVILPVGTAFATSAHLTQTIHRAPWPSLLEVGLFGFGWGAGSVFFGLGIDLAGMALGMTVMSGLIDAFGTIVPLAILSPQVLVQRRGHLIIFATAVTILGVAICGYAAHLRGLDLARDSSGASRTKSVPLLRALVVCTLSGILSAMFNFGYAFSDRVVETARQVGASADASLNVVWVLLLLCGAIPNIFYCIYLLQRNQTWGLYMQGYGSRPWVLAMTMGFLWLGGVLLYGMAGDRMGNLGPSLGWAIWNAIIVLTSTICGLAVGEWGGARRRSVAVLWMGVAILILSIGILGAAGAGAI